MAEIIILGIIISIVFYELTDISPGGIIVPGLMVIYVSQWTRMLYTVAIAILAYYIVKLLSARFIIFGKRRFVMLIIVSLAWHFAINFILGLFFNDLSGLTISVVGYTIAGIIANNIYKQGIKRTVPSLAIVVCLLEIIILVLGQLGVSL